MAKKKNPQLELERRNQIMLTSLKLMIEESHQSMTLEKVAKQTGLSKGLISYYFKNKDTLILETMHFFLNMHKQRLMAIVYQEAPVKIRVKNLIEAALPSTQDIEQMMRFHSEILSFAKSNPKAEKAIRQFYMEFRKICEEIIKVGTKEGYVKNKNTEWAAIFIHALFDGLGFQISLDPKLDVSKLRKQVFQLLDQLLTHK